MARDENPAESYIHVWISYVRSWWRGKTAEAGRWAHAAPNLREQIEDATDAKVVTNDSTRLGKVWWFEEEWPRMVEMRHQE